MIFIIYNEWYIISAFLKLQAIRRLVLPPTIRRKVVAPNFLRLCGRQTSPLWGPCRKRSQTHPLIRFVSFVGRHQTIRFAENAQYSSSSKSLTWIRWIQCYIFAATSIGVSRNLINLFFSIYFSADWGMDTSYPCAPTRDAQSRSSSTFLQHQQPCFIASFKFWLHKSHTHRTYLVMSLRALNIVRNW